MRIKPVIRGLLTYAPPLERLIPKATGGTDTARYCYSVWLRHLVSAHEMGLDTDPRVVAELGPGDSLGMGLAALLSGADTYYGFDVVEYASAPRNRAVLEGLVDLFGARAPIPGPDEFPNVAPALSSYAFPSAILTESRLTASLDAARVAEIRRAVDALGGAGGRAGGRVTLAYRAPWDDPSVVEPESVDLVFSQAVLEHVDDLDATYDALARWLKPGGHASHQIDFFSHELTREWNGHWTIPDFEWKLIRGRRAYLLNREPATTHLDLARGSGLDVVGAIRDERPSEVERVRLAAPFRGISDRDLGTRGLFLVAVKPNRHAEVRRTEVHP
jgi:SAM-dependent methyltransferase